jgi:hypothetical protein
MFIYRLVTPLDDFDDLVALPDWPRDASPASVAWVLQAVLALQDGAEHVGWRGDMRHLPSVGIPSGPAGTDHVPHLVIKQDDNGATFIVSSIPLSWARSPQLRTHHHHAPPHQPGHPSHPSIWPLANGQARNRLVLYRATN